MSGDVITISVDSDTVEVAVITLIGVYYVFQIEYPRAYCQVLGYLQQLTLAQPYTGKKIKAFVQELATYYN